MQLSTRASSDAGAGTCTDGSSMHARLSLLSQRAQNGVVT